MYLGIFLLTALCSVIHADVFHINDRQNSECQVSNFCERSLSLKCEDRNEKKPVLTFNASSTDPWDAVCSQILGTKNVSETLTIEGPVFEVREICTEIKNVKNIIVTYVRISGGTTQFQAKGMHATTTKYRFCIKKLLDDHEVVRSVSLRYIPQQKKVMKIALSFAACGDITGTGKVNTFPDETLKEQEEGNRKKGHGECIDEHTLNYDNRQFSMISFSLGTRPNAERAILEGSGKSYTGKKGKKIRLDFNAERNGINLLFAWWKVCFLVRYATNITFEMEGRVNKWIQSIDVCDPQSYLWKCYHPWGRFDEIEKGSVIFEPVPDSDTPIVIKDMSITACFDTQFTGDMLRIGPATIKCRDAVNRTDICDDLISIGPKHLTDFQSPFDFSDDETKHNTSRAWKTVHPRDPVIAKKGVEHMFFIYTLRRKCPELDDNRFQARAVRFWTQYVERVIVKFCDVNHPIKTKPLSCDSKMRNFTIWTNPSKGKTITIKIKNPEVAKRVLVNNWFVSTGVKIQLLASSPETNPMRIWKFNMLACCDPKFNKRDSQINSMPDYKNQSIDTDMQKVVCTVQDYSVTNMTNYISEVREEPDIGKDREPLKISPDICVERYNLTFKSKNFFKFTDKDPERDEKAALQGSQEEYRGAPGKDVYFYISAKDGKNFEWWTVSGRYFNVTRVTYIMETSTVTYAQSKSFCGIDVWHRTQYWPRNQGIYVKRGVVKMEVVPGRMVTVTGFDMAGCRDHYKFKYNLHVHPCDYKSLVIKTPRCQTITVYALKDKVGNWQQTELYHVTDYTGNDGDNTWFTLEPKHHLVSSIWTNGTYIGLKWEIAKRRVVFEVYLTTKIKIHTRITVLDLDQLLELKNVPVNITIEQLDSGDHCVGLPFDVEQCEDDALVTKCLVKTDKTFVVPGRYVPSQKNYEFLLPKEKFNGSSPMHICTSIARVMEQECAKHAILNRIQHQFICDRIKRTVDGYASLSNERAIKSRMYQACLFTFKTLRWTCAVMADRPKSARAYFFTSACKEGKKFTIVDFYKKYFKKTTKVDVTPEALDVRNTHIITDPATHSFDIKNNSLPKLCATEDTFTIHGVKTTPAILTKDYSKKFEICILYGCATGSRGEAIEIVHPSRKFFVEEKLCTNLLISDCCFEIGPLTSFANTQLLLRYYRNYNSSDIPLQFDEFIPIV